MTQPQGSPPRRRTLASFASKGVGRTGFGFGNLGTQIYGFVLLLGLTVGLTLRRSAVLRERVRKLDLGYLFRRHESSYQVY
jgi:hypothetical protein